MTSWYSRAVSAAAAQVSSLRSTLLSSEADGDTEDDTHVCRVLRTHYTEKGRVFPDWLPPDPKAPAQAPVVVAATSQSAAGSRYGNFNGSTTSVATAPAATGLSSLWGNDSPSPSPQQQSANDMRRKLGGAADYNPRPQHQSVDETNSAQQRIRRLYGGNRTTSPQSSGPFAPPRGGGQAGSGDYEDRFAPGNYNGGGMRANEPWAGGDMGGFGYGGQPAGGGLPSNPRRGLPANPRR